MPDTRIYSYEPELQGPHTYELGAEGLVYRPPSGDRRVVRWTAIRYLEDISGRKVDIVADGDAARIPLFYGTRRFSDLLSEVCARLSELHGDQLAGPATFRGNRAFFAHTAAVLGVFGVLVFGSLVVLDGRMVVWLFIVAATLPMAIFVLRQPHTVTVGEDGLLVKTFLRPRLISYGDIAAIRFDLYGDKHTAYLCIRVELTSGRRVTILRFENLVLLYLMMTFNWQRYRAGQRA